LIRREAEPSVGGQAGRKVQFNLPADGGGAVPGFIPIDFPWHLANPCRIRLTGKQKGCMVSARPDIENKHYNRAKTISN